jgi:regulator of replication initiation timing
LGCKFMQSLNAILKQAEIKIRELENDLKKIKKQITFLVEENNSLRAALAQAYGQTGQNEEKKGENDEQTGGAYDNLKNLCDQGFHVCNVHFGHIRKEECLFCISLLERSKNKGKAGA